MSTINNIQFTNTHYIAIVHRYTNKPIVLCEEMLSVNIVRDIKNPGHSFSLSIKPIGDYLDWTGPDYVGEDNDYIGPGDWIEIYAAGPSVHDQIKASHKTTIKVPLLRKKEPYEVHNCVRRFIGIIERVENDESIQNGVPSIDINISGKAWGKTLLESPVMLIPWFKGPFPGVRRMSDVKMEASPDENVRKILELFYAVNQHKIPPSLRKKMKKCNVERKEAARVSNLPKADIKETIYNYVEFRLDPCDGKVMDTQLLTAVSGAWQLIEQYHEKTMNEIWADLNDDGNPMLVMREYPYSDFNTMDWDLMTGLRTYFGEIDTVEVDYKRWEGRKVGKSDHERSNWWVATSTSHPQHAVLGQKGVLYAKSLQHDIESINKYGMRQMEVEALYSFYPDRKDKDGWLKITTRFSKIMRHWYEHVHHLLSGTLVINDQFDLKIGKRLKINNIKAWFGGKEYSEEYYIVGVTESWTFKKSAIFNVSVCRGKRLKSE